MYTPNPSSGERPHGEKPAAEPRRRKRFNRRIGFWITLLVVLILIIDWMHMHHLFGHAKTKKAPPAVPVVLAQAQTANVPVTLVELGSVTPVYTVTVKTQINGQLMRVLYTEGQMVKAGELIAQIDPRPFLAQLVEYEGQLMRDQALLANGLIDLKRYQTLWKQDSTSQQVLATQQSLVRQLEGAVKIDQGLLETVKVNLIYCNITSPIDGRIGLRLVDPGNFVQTSDTTGIAVITSLNPIEVVFTIPEDSVSQVWEQFNSGKKLTVNAYDRQQNKLLSVGTLYAIDNLIDSTTGMVKLKATFTNEDYRLFPNQFVNAELIVKTLENVVVIPTAAIQRGPQGNFVYLLNTNKTVSVKPVVTGINSGNNTVINSGVLAGQSVVTEGTDKLVEGSLVSNDPPKPLVPTQATKVGV